jgi:DNA-binding transcriptional LysR family regulator
MSITLKQLRYAVATARHGNITLAAEELHVSQPSISVAIQQLEEHFGHALFTRQRGTGVGLTAIGTRIIIQAKQLLADANGLENLAVADGSVSGDLMVDCFEDLAPYCVPAILVRLREQHPELNVIVHEQSFDGIGRRLAEGASDLALTYDLGLPSDVRVDILRELVPHALLAEDNPLCARDTVSLKELSNFSLILTAQAQSWQHVLELFRMHNLAPSSYVKTSSFEMQRSMVANGLGCAVVYTRPYGEHSYDGRRLVRRPIANSLPLQRILAAYPGRNRPSAAVTAFVKAATAFFTEFSNAA